MSKAGFPVFLKKTQNMNTQKQFFLKQNNTETQTPLLKPATRISKIFWFIY